MCLSARERAFTILLFMEGVEVTSIAIKHRAVDICIY